MDEAEGEVLRGGGDEVKSVQRLQTRSPPPPRALQTFFATEYLVSARARHVLASGSALFITSHSLNSTNFRSVLSLFTAASRYPRTSPHLSAFSSTHNAVINSAL